MSPLPIGILTTPLSAHESVFSSPCVMGQSELVVIRLLGFSRFLLFICNEGEEAVRMLVGLCQTSPICQRQTQADASTCLCMYLHACMHRKEKRSFFSAAQHSKTLLWLHYFDLSRSDGIAFFLNGRTSLK